MATVSDCPQTTLTILSWALLAVVAWYTPVATSNGLQRLATGPDWNYAYQQLWKGIGHLVLQYSPLGGCAGAVPAGFNWYPRKDAEYYGSPRT